MIKTIEMYSLGMHSVASQARLFRAVAELTARESHEEEELLPELLQLDSDCAEEPGLRGYALSSDSGIY